MVVSSLDGFVLAANRGYWFCSNCVFFAPAVFRFRCHGVLQWWLLFHGGFGGGQWCQWLPACGSGDGLVVVGALDFRSCSSQVQVGFCWLGVG